MAFLLSTAFLSSMGFLSEHSVSFENRIPFRYNDSSKYGISSEYCDSFKYRDSSWRFFMASLSDIAIHPSMSIETDKGKLQNVSSLAAQAYICNYMARGIIHLSIQPRRPQMPAQRLPETPLNSSHARSLWQKYREMPSAWFSKVKERAAVSGPDMS